jgi:hypothetical protein
MELIDALVNEDNEDIIEISFTGDEDEWHEIAAALRESDSDLATEVGLKILDAVKHARG